MGKSITKLPDYAVANNQCGVLTLVSGNAYDGHDITVGQVKTALGETFGEISELCTSSKINKWAAYKPGHISASGSPYDTYTYVPDEAPHNLGDFIGYNHNAKAPVHYAAAVPTDYEVEQGEWGQIDVELARGEMEPCGGSSDKDFVDVQLQYNGGTVEHNRIAIPAVGDTVVVSFYDQIITAGTLDVRPVYYSEVSEDVFQEIAVIEDGVRSVDITVTSSPLSFSGSIEHTLGYIINPMSVQFDWSLVNNMLTDKTINARIKVYGDYTETTYTTLSLAEFSPDEEQTGSEDIVVTSTLNGTYQATHYILQIAKNIDPEFNFPYNVANGYFLWTPEE
ncbi:MAG: hypothetical protein JZU65_06065 [Chlorobium sp.]|nr:hypothetical protein [Chlorobium sp.]